MRIGSSRSSSWNLLDSVFVYATKFHRSVSFKFDQDGMVVPGRPRVRVSKRSWSVGRPPVGVERILKIPRLRFLGFGKT
jgi:hypothetical protein